MSLAGDAATSQFGALTTADGRPPRVAIVGGTPSSAMVAEALCAQFGCTSTTTPTGESVLALLRKETPLDLVVIDLSVPDMDGLVAVQLIRALGARGTLPIVALTNDRADMAAPRARAAGFAGALVKPYSPRELYAALHVALDRAARQVVGTA